MMPLHTRNKQIGLLIFILFFLVLLGAILIYFLIDSNNISGQPAKLLYFTEIRLYPYFFMGFCWCFYFWVAFSLLSCSALGNDFTRITSSATINTQAYHNDWSQTAVVEGAQLTNPINTPSATRVLGSDDLGDGLGSFFKSQLISESVSSLDI